MLHCKPMCEYFTDSAGNQKFNRVQFYFWDDRDFFDPEAVRRDEEYEDIDEAIERLDEVGKEPSFDTTSRLRSSMLANWLREFKKNGVLNPRDPDPKDDELLVKFNGLGILRN